MRYLNLFLILFTITSCRGLPPAKSITVERCFPLMEEVALDEEILVRGICQCHKYKVGDEIKRVSESYSMPLMYCNKEATFKNYPTTLYPFLEEWRVYLLQQ